MAAEKCRQCRAVTRHFSTICQPLLTSPRKTEEPKCRFGSHLKSQHTNLELSLIPFLPFCIFPSLLTMGVPFGNCSNACHSCRAHKVYVMDEEIWLTASAGEATTVLNRVIHHLMVFIIVRASPQTSQDLRS